MSNTSFDGDRRSSGILGGLRVVECGEGISAAFGAKLMADLGADVIKVEAPAGDILRRRGPFAAGEKPDPERAACFSISMPTSEELRSIRRLRTRRLRLITCCQAQTF